MRRSNSRRDRDLLRQFRARLEASRAGLHGARRNLLRNMVVHTGWQVDNSIIADVIETRLRRPSEMLDPLMGDLERNSS